MEDEIEVLDESLEDEIEVHEENIYYVPTGTIEIINNGIHDVTKYDKANVNVQPSKDTLEITENGTYDVTDYKQANVQTAGYGMNDIFANITNDNHSNYSRKSMIKIVPEIMVDEATNISSSFANCDFLNEVVIKFRNCNEPVNFGNLFYPSCDIQKATLVGEQTTFLDGSNNYVFGKLSDLKLENIQLKCDSDSLRGMSVYCLENSNLVNVDAGDFLKDLVNYTYKGTSVYLESATSLTKDSLLSIINSLGTDSKNACKLILGETNKAKLTDEELQMITNKGWNYE